MGKFALFAGLFLACALHPSAALAFNRSTVLFADNPVQPGLYWQDRQIALLLKETDSSGQPLDVSASEIRAAILESMLTWNSAGGQACTDLSLTLENEEPDDVISAIFPSGNGMTNGQNTIIFWPAADWNLVRDPQELAVTTTLYFSNTGEIFEADIDINDGQLFSVGVADVDTRDVQNTLTHELGHLIGFAHTSDAESTMFSTAALGEIEKRSLTQDDINGVCEVYPAGDDSPEQGISMGRMTASGCSTGDTGARAPSGLFLILAARVLLRPERLSKTRRIHQLRRWWKSGEGHMDSRS